MARVHSDADVRAAAVAAGERTAKWGSDLIMRSDLAAAIRSYATTDDARTLDGLEFATSGGQGMISTPTIGTASASFCNASSNCRWRSTATWMSGMMVSR